MKKDKVHTQEIGLVAGSILGRYFFKAEDLHYGLWEKGLKLDVSNFAQSQEAYSEFLISNIPEITKSILDVGCGIGTLALKLLDRGYKVDCVSPSPFLTEEARHVLGQRSYIFESVYEKVETEKTYDLILFGESFQYVKMSKGLEQSLAFLNHEGHMLICDFFKTDAPGKSVLGGGHRLSKFYACIADYPFECIKDIDITERIAPNLDLINEMMNEVGMPVWKLLQYSLDSNYPLISKMLKWKYKKKIRTIEQRYFSGERNADNFKKYKSYRLLLFKKQEVGH